MSESYTPQSDVYKVLHSLPSTNSARLPTFLKFIPAPLCTSAKGISFPTLECGFGRLGAAGVMLQGTVSQESCGPVLAPPLTSNGTLDIT